MVIHKCDRCGEIIDSFDLVIFPSSHGNPSCESVELCENCYGKLKQWIFPSDNDINEKEVHITISGSEDGMYDFDPDHWRMVTDKTERNNG